MFSSGAWLAINGEAIYNTKYWTAQNDTVTGTVWYTQSNDGKRIYASILEWPNNNTLYLGSISPPRNTRITLLGYPSNISVSVSLFLS